jgi:AcrR family transcriptional regulator
MPAQVRRTQTERSARTKDLLMEATMECLYEVGYRGTSIRVVEERSGVSRGAILHHFASRTELLIGAVQHIARLRGERMRQEAKGIGATEGVEGLIDLMWRQFSDPLFYTSLELWNAARTDLELQEALYAEERALGTFLRDIASEMFDVAADDDAVLTAFELTWQFMRGAAVTMILKHDVVRQQQLIASWRAVISPMFLPRRKAAR